jgi:hypothetical protein
MGKTSTGDSITYQGRSQYSRSYARRKGRFSPIDLKDTGSFHSKTFAEVSGSNILFSSTDSKTDMLKKKSGEDIFGLTDSSKFIAQEKGNALLIEVIKTQLQL